MKLVEVTAEKIVMKTARLQDFRRQIRAQKTGMQTVLFCYTPKPFIHKR